MRSKILCKLLSAVILMGNVTCVSGYATGHDLVYTSVSGKNTETSLNLGSSREVGGGAVIVYAFTIEEIITLPLFPVTFLIGSTVGLIGGLGRSGELESSRRWELALDPTTPGESLRSLAGSSDEQFRCRVAGHQNTPADVLDKLARDRVWWVRSVAARNPKMPVASLKNLAQDSHEQVRESTASNPLTPADSLARLADDPDWKVKLAVKNNYHCPPVAQAKLVDLERDYAVYLARLAKTGNTDARLEAAGNKYTPGHALRKLADDVNVKIREKVACNRNTPPEVLAILANDICSEVRWEAAQNPKTPKIHRPR